jgi:hypothetical protein
MRREIIETRAPGRLVIAISNHKYIILLTYTKRKKIQVIFNSIYNFFLFY